MLDGNKGEVQSSLGGGRGSGVAGQIRLMLPSGNSLTHAGLRSQTAQPSTRKGEGGEQAVSAPPAPGLTSPGCWLPSNQPFPPCLPVSPHTAPLCPVSPLKSTFVWFRNALIENCQYLAQSRSRRETEQSKGRHSKFPSLGDLKLLSIILFWFWFSCGVLYRTISACPLESCCKRRQKDPRERPVDYVFLAKEKGEGSG